MPKLMESLLDLILIRIRVRFRKLVVIDALNQSTNRPRRALLYYKTSPLASSRLVSKSRHTNDGEILSMISVLDDKGFAVDVIDREASLKQVMALSDVKYDLLISNCAGNSAPHHHVLVDFFNYKSLVAWAMGPDPALSVEKNIARHSSFFERTGVRPVIRRLVSGNQEEWDRRFERCSAIIVNGKPGTFSFESYRRHKKPIYYVPSVVSEQVYFSGNVDKKRSPRTFIFFGGNGLICKGLDLVLEAFDGLHGLELHVFGPSGEEDFWGHYKALIDSNPQIHFHGFVEVGGAVFRDVSSRAGYQIFPASAEGSATSVLTAMRAGVVPIVTYETGIDVKPFGFQLPERHVNVKELRVLIGRLSTVGKSELRRRSNSAHRASLENHEDVFKVRFKLAINDIIGSWEEVGDEKSPRD